jgi:hypothetical protein
MANFNVGQTSAGGSSGGYSGITAVQITMPQSGILQSVSIFWNSNPGVNFLLGIYSDNAGVPGTLLATSAVAVTNGGPSQTLPTTTQPTLTTGTKYWLTTQQQSSVGGYFDSGGLGAFYNGEPWTGTLPTTWSGTPGTGAFLFSLYATFATVVGLDFQVHIADTSTVNIGFHGATGFSAGNTTLGGTSGTFGGITGTKITLTQAGVLQSISFWSDNTAGTPLNLGLYSDSGGVPGTLLATCAPTANLGGPAALNTLPTTTHPTLSPGDYWLAEMASSSLIGYFNNVGSAITGAWNGGTSWGTGVMPSPWPTASTGAFQFSLYASFNAVTALHFPMAIADTSTVVALGMEINRHFPLAIADTSTVIALRFRIGQHFPLAIADTSTVLALGFHTGQHFPVQIADTSTVVALGFRIGLRFGIQIADTSTVALGFHTGQRFPVQIADTSTVVALGFHIATGVTLRFPMAIADTSSVLALGFRLGLHFPVQIQDSSTVAISFHLGRRFSVQIADTSTVHLSWSLPTQRFPIAIGDSSTVWISFENDHFHEPLTVPPYAGEDQPVDIIVPATIYYREVWEEGPWVMPPYAWIYPQPPEPVIEERGYDQVHHDWLLTHPRPPGPRRMGDRDHRPQSVLPPYVRPKPIMIKK